MCLPPFALGFIRGLEELLNVLNPLLIQAVVFLPDACALDELSMDALSLLVIQLVNCKITCKAITFNTDVGVKTAAVGVFKSLEHFDKGQLHLLQALSEVEDFIPEVQDDLPVSLMLRIKVPSDRSQLPQVLAVSAGWASFTLFRRGNIFWRVSRRFLLLLFRSRLA